MRDFNLSWLRNGAVDRTPRALGLVTCTRDGQIRYEQRRMGVDHRVLIASPQPGQFVGREAVEVLVQAYDTTSPVASLTASLTGTGGSLPAVSLAAEGVSRWRALLDASGVAPGYYDVSVTGAFADGTPIFQTVSFVLNERRLADVPPLLGGLELRRDAAGSAARDRLVHAGARHGGAQLARRRGRAGLSRVPRGDGPGRSGRHGLRRDERSAALVYAPSERRRARARRSRQHADRHHHV
jgi:hypothetical protein